MRTAGVRALAIGVVTAIVAAACGGGASPTQPSAAASGGGSAVLKAKYAQGVTDTSIKVGIFGPFSGSAAAYSKAQKMTIALLKDANEKGGINGRKFDVVESDDACDATTMQGIIRKFAEQDKVFFIHGGSCSNAVVASRDVIERLGIPVLSANAASGLITAPPLKNLFQPKPTSDESGMAIAAFMKSNAAAKRIGIIGQSDEVGQTQVKAVLAGLQKVGLEVVANEQIAPDAGDSTPQVRKLIGAKPDMIMAALYPQPMSVFLRDANKQGLSVPVVTSDIARPDEQVDRLKSREPVKSFFSFTNILKPINDASLKKYSDIYAKYYPNDKWDGVAAEGAISGDLILQLVAKLGGDLTWDAWIQTMETTTFQTTVGGALSFKAFNGSDPLTRRATKDTAFQVLDPSKTDSTVTTVKDWSEWQKIAPK